MDSIIINDDDDNKAKILHVLSWKLCWKKNPNALLFLHYVCWLFIGARWFSHNYDDRQQKNFQNKNLLCLKFIFFFTGKKLLVFCLNKCQMIKEKSILIGVRIQAKKTTKPNKQTKEESFETLLKPRKGKRIFIYSFFFFFFFFFFASRFVDLFSIYSFWP